MSITTSPSELYGFSRLKGSNEMSWVGRRRRFEQDGWGGCGFFSQGVLLVFMIVWARYTMAHGVSALRSDWALLPVRTLSNVNMPTPLGYSERLPL